MIHELTDLTRNELIKILAVVRVPRKPRFIYPVVRLAGLRLAGMDFFGMNLIGVDFSRSILRGCRFGYAVIKACDFMDCDLGDSDWRDVDLQTIPEEDSAFNNADLRGSKWNDVSAVGNLFEGTNFSGADLRDADFSECACWGAKFKGARLSGSKWISAKLRDHVFDEAEFSPNVTFGTFALNGQETKKEVRSVGKRESFSIQPSLS